MTESHAVSIVGAGDMGHGFAAHFALEGQDITLIDHRQSNLDWARDHIREVVTFLNEEGLSTASPEAVLDEITFTLDSAAGVEDADIVLETVTEVLDVKHEVFAELGAAAPDDAVLASNTSGLQITAIADGVPEFRERIAGCHWLYPPYLLPTVEVVRGDHTADATIDRLCGFIEAVDRDPIRVERDVSGFVWNRVQTAVVRECLHLVEEGVASIDDVNRAIRDGYATRTAAIGPFETIDIAGLDLFKTVSAELNPRLCDADEPSPLFDDRLDAGRGGIEDGAGFYDYDEPAEAVTRARDEKVAAIRRALGADDDR